MKYYNRLMRWKIREPRREALRLLQRASEISRDDPVILTRIGSLSTDLGKWAEAETALLRAIEVERDFAFAYFYLGFLYVAEDRREAAIAMFTTAARLDESPITLTALGVAQLDSGMIEEARQFLRRAISIDPNYEEALYKLATTLTVDDTSEAISLFQRAIEIDPAYSIAYRELGWAFRRNEEYFEAEYYVRRTLELDISDGWAHIYLGNVMWALEDKKAAERSFEDAIRVWPDLSLPYWCLAHFLEYQGENQRAEALYAKALQIDPGDAQANYRWELPSGCGRA